MSNLLMLALCLLAGTLLRRSGRVADSAHTVLNAVIIHLSLPAVTLRNLHGFRIDAASRAPVLMPWVLFAIGALLFWALGQALKLPRASVGALTLVGGVGNTSFVGLPMIESLQGPEGMALGLLIDQLASYLALSTIGVVAATLYAAEGPLSARSMARKVATFPPFIALAAAALALSPVAFAPALDSMLGRIGDTLAPLALLSIGMQVRLDALPDNARLLAFGLGYKLLVCRALVVGALWLLHAEPDMTSRVSVIAAAMPPMIGAGIVAAQARLDARLVSMMISLGVPLGVVTACGWHWACGLALV